MSVWKIKKYDWMKKSKSWKKWMKVLEGLVIP